MATSRWIVVVVGAALVAGLVGVWLLMRPVDDGTTVVDVLRPATAAAPADGTVPETPNALLRPAAPLGLDADGQTRAAPDTEPGAGEASIDGDDLPAGVERTRITGRVLDEFGAPFADALVVYVPDWESAEATGLPSSSYGMDLDAMPGQLTAADGRFDFPAPWSSKRWSAGMPGFKSKPVLVVRAPGMAIHSFLCTGFLGGSYDAGELVVDVPAGTLRAWLVDEGGAPVAGVKAGIWSWGAADEVKEHPALDTRAFNFMGLVTDISGDDGLVELTGLWPSKVNLGLLHDAYDSLHMPDVVVGRGEVVDLGVLVMGAGAGLSGLVVDARGEPVEGAEVFVRKADASWHLTGVEPGRWVEYDVVPALLASLDSYRGLPTDTAPVVTDADGAFLKTGLPGEVYDVIASAQGLEPVRIASVPVGSADLRLVLSDPAAYALSVVSQDADEPVGGAHVDAWRRSGLPVYYREPLRTPCEVLRGTEALRASEALGLPASEILILGVGPLGTEVVASAPGFATRGYRLPGLQPGETGTHTLRLWRAAALMGRVVDDAGAAVGDAKVSLTPPTALRVKLEKVETTSDADGHYRFDALTGGDWSLGARAPGHLPAEARSLHVRPEALTTAEDVVLQRESTISGVLRQPDGMPAAGTLLQAMRPNPDRADNSYIGANAEAGPDGAFLLKGLSAGTYALSASPGLRLDVRLGPAEHVELDLVLKRPPRISGWVRSAGAPLPGAQVFARRQFEQDASRWFLQPKPVTTDVDGRYLIDLPSEGEWLVYAQWKHGGRSGGQMIPATWGAEYHLDFELGAGRLAGRVADARDGSVPRDVQARLLRDGEPIADWANLAQSGAFDYVRLGAASYSVEARGGVFATGTSGELTLEPGEQRTDVRVELPLGAVVHGIVEGPDGQPTGAWVYLVDDATRDLEQQGAPKGAFRFEGIDPGSYRVLVAWPSFGYAYEHPDPGDEGDLSAMIQVEETVTLQPGEARRVTLHEQ